MPYSIIARQIENAAKRSMTIICYFINTIVCEAKKKLGMKYFSA